MFREMRGNNQGNKNLLPVAIDQTIHTVVIEELRSFTLSLWLISTFNVKIIAALTQRILYVPLCSFHCFVSLCGVWTNDRVLQQLWGPQKHPELSDHQFNELDIIFIIKVSKYI